MSQGLKPPFYNPSFKCTFSSFVLEFIIWLIHTALSSRVINVNVLNPSCHFPTKITSANHLAAPD